MKDATSLAVLKHWLDNIEKAKNGTLSPRDAGQSKCAYCWKYANSWSCGDCPLVRAGRCGCGPSTPHYTLLLILTCRRAEELGSTRAKELEGNVLAATRKVYEWLEKVMNEQNLI